MFSRHSNITKRPLRHISMRWPDRTHLVLLSFGERLQEARRFEEAAAAFRKVVDLDPNHCNGWLSLGAALLGLHQYADSLAAFRRALALEPGSAVGYCNMSLALMGLYRIEEAVEACRKALFIEAGSPVASFNLGCALLTLGKIPRRLGSIRLPFHHGRKQMATPRGACGAVDRRAAGGQIDTDTRGAGKWRSYSVFALHTGAERSRRISILCCTPRQVTSAFPHARCLNHVAVGDSGRTSISIFSAH